MPRTDLAALEALRLQFGGDAAAKKLALLRALHRQRLPSAQAVRRLHEALCFVVAYPDDAAVRSQARAMLAGFARRTDLRTHRTALADSGIAGTAIDYRFFAGQAMWLAARWPAQLRLDRGDAAAAARIAQALPALLTPAEAQALVELKPGGFAALDRLRPRTMTDATFLLARIAALPGGTYRREQLSDAIDASYRLAPGSGTPSRSAALYEAAPVVWRRTPPPRARPDLRAAIARAPGRVRRLGRSAAGELIDLARAAMVVRARSLEAFSFADPRDTWWADDGDGLAFALFGVLPERRHFVAAMVGGLMLRNGVPVGYLQSDHAGAHAALSFNTFDTFRGGEAAHLFARWLALLHALYGAASFSIEPYQLGRDNHEALASGAWWFYRRLGFAPHDAVTLQLAQREEGRLRRTPGARSGPAVLRRLASRHLFFDLDPQRPAPLLPLAEIGLAAGAALSARHGAYRERAAADAGAELMRRLGLPSLAGFGAAQREAWRRLAPVLVRLDLERWSAAERAALAALVRAKGGSSERDYVASFAAHPCLAPALLDLARSPEPQPGVASPRPASRPGHQTMRPGHSA